MGSATLCNKYCNPTSSFATPPVRMHAHSQENDEEDGSYGRYASFPQNEPIKYIGSIRNISPTGGFVFEVKRFDSIKNPYSKHNSCRSINTELCSKSTNINFTTHTASVASPFSTLKSNGDLKTKEVINSIEKDIHLNPTKSVDLAKLKTGEPSIANNSKPIEQKEGTQSQLSPIIEENNDKMSEMSIEAKKAFRKQNKIKLVCLEKKKMSMKPILQNKTKNDCVLKKIDTLEISTIDKGLSSNNVVRGLENKFSMLYDGDYEPISPIAKKEYVIP